MAEKDRKSLKDLGCGGLTEWELDVVTKVFRSFETGLREGTINAKDLHPALKMLGLNPLEQEILDLTNEIARNGYIYFPAFCSAVHKKYREEDEQLFRQNMFKVLCGTKPFSDKFKAKKYKLQDQFIMKKDFVNIMKNLPEEVSDCDIDEMFTYADADCDGRISWTEFQTMIIPQPVSGNGGGARWASRPTPGPSKTVHPCTLSVSGLAMSRVAPAAPGDQVTVTNHLNTWETMSIAQQ